MMIVIIFILTRRILAVRLKGSVVMIYDTKTLAIQIVICS